MIEILKNNLTTKIENWLLEIEESVDKKTVIDISTVFEEIFASTISEILLGEDVSDIKVDIDFRISNAGSDFVRKSLTL